VAHLARRHANCHLRVAIGSDNLAELPRWKEIDRLQALAPLLVVPRTGHLPGTATRPLLPEIASSEIRALVVRGGDPRPFVDDAVATYIAEHELYRSADGGPT
jgi:nicotinate-nucleotide adenylyltransferase